MSYSVCLRYIFLCDSCGCSGTVDRDNPLISSYNAAQACRSLGWEYSRSGRILCPKCRKRHFVS